MIRRILLGVANVGRALRAQLELAQVTQQAVRARATASPSRPLRGTVLSRGCAVQRAQRGQSMVELALIAPVLALMLLGAADAGLALNTHMRLTQQVQQASATFVTDSPPSGNNTRYYYQHQVALFLQQNGFPAVSDSDVTVQPVPGPPNQLMLQITVSDTYHIIFPLANLLNSGPWHHGTLTLSATVSTIAATAPVTNVKVTSWVPGTGCTQPASLSDLTPDHLVTWTAASGPDNLPVDLPQYLTYAVSSNGVEVNSNLPGTQFCDTHGTTGTSYDYTVAAVQSNGLTSPASVPVTYP